VLDHISLRVADYAKSKLFYQQALAPLGYSLAMENSSGAGFRSGHIPAFWVKEGAPPTANWEALPSASDGCGGPLLHVAFVAQTRDQVDDFHRAALAAGGRDNGRPGLRPFYHPNYYGAFVLDPDGYNIEAVCHRPV
jgi:catechol 2,3-dioxygenase-like lactoylglutathione lyase family enzyme